MLKGFLRALTALAFVAGMTAAAPAPSLAQDDPTLIVNMTTDDVWSGQMALGFARKIQEDGGKVVVFLNVRAVSLANKKVPQHVQAGSGKTPHEVIAAIIAAGGRVFLCPSCTEQAGLGLEERVEGVELGGPEYRAIVMAPGTRIISY